MNQNRLNNLTLMSMEYELLRKLDISTLNATIKRVFSKKHVNIRGKFYIVEFNLLCHFCCYDIL